MLLLRCLFLIFIFLPQIELVRCAGLDDYGIILSGDKYKASLYGVGLNDNVNKLISYCETNNFDCKIYSDHVVFNAEDLNNDYPYVVYYYSNDTINEIHFINTSYNIEKEHVKLYKMGLGLEERHNKSNGNITTVYIDHNSGNYIGFKSMKNATGLIGAYWTGLRFKSLYGPYDDISKNKNIEFKAE